MPIPGSPWSPAPAPASERPPPELLPLRAFMWSRWPAARTESTGWPTRSAARRWWPTSPTTPRWTPWRRGLTRVDVLVNNAGGAKGLRTGRRGRSGRLALDVGDQRHRHAAGDPGAAAQADRLGRRTDRHGHLDRRPGGLRRRRPATPRPSTPRARCTGPCAANCSESRCGSPRSRRARCRPSSHWCASAATSNAREAVYAGITPLGAQDVAEVIGFVASRPSHVNIDQIVIRPRDQASASRFNRRG